MIRVLASVLALFFVAGCTADHKWASDADVARARYVDAAPTSITLLTSINTRTKTGAHAGLLINGTERVLFDPAGSWEQPAAPEREDMHYGMTPVMLASYVNYQGSAVFQLTEQTIYVSPALAQQIMDAAIAYGSANKSECTKAISTVLRNVPGFESLPMTWFPKTMSKAFALLPGVYTQTLTSKDGNLRFTLPGPTLSALPASPAE